MHRRTRLAQLLFVTVLGFTGVAFAQEPSAAPSADSAGPVSAPESGAAPAATEGAPVSSEGAPATAEGAPAETAATSAAAKAVADSHYGVALRWRGVFLPSWFLGLFAEKNVALSTWNNFALEGYWRKRDKEDKNRTWEIVVSVGYQNMTVSDGYWLGRGKEATMDTDLVQTPGLSLITIDAAYVIRQYLSPYFGIHYGAGLGLGVVRGRVLRTSATCDPATGQCQVVINQTPNVCGGANPPCTEANLKASENYPDQGPGEPHRFEENSVPGAIPIVNLLFGLDFPIPDAKGLEFRIEGGFYDAFFLGATAGYIF